MNKILPIILVTSLFLVPDLLIAREGYEGYSPRTGGSSGSSIFGWIFLGFLVIGFFAQAPEFAMSVAASIIIGYFFGPIAALAALFFLIYVVMGNKNE